MKNDSIWTNKYLEYSRCVIKTNIYNYFFPLLRSTSTKLINIGFSSTTGWLKLFSLISFELHPVCRILSSWPPEIMLTLSIVHKILSNTLNTCKSVIRRAVIQTYCHLKILRWRSRYESIHLVSTDRTSSFYTQSLWDKQMKITTGKATLNLPENESTESDKRKRILAIPTSAWPSSLTNNTALSYKK